MRPSRPTGCLALGNSRWFNNLYLFHGGDLAGNVLSALSTSSGGVGGLDEATVAAGLKEALTVGSERAVATTSKTNGFWGNELIRIAMPDELATMAKTLRSIGFGSQVDAMEVAMNRAAERASEV